MSWKPGPSRDTINVLTGEAVTRIIAFDPIAGAHVFEAPKVFEGNPGTPHPSGGVGGLPGGESSHGGHPAKVNGPQTPVEGSSYPPAWEGKR